MNKKTKRFLLSVSLICPLLISSCRRNFITVSSTSIIIPSHDSSQLSSKSESTGDSSSKESSSKESSSKESSSKPSSSHESSSSKPSSKESSSSKPSSSQESSSSKPSSKPSSSKESSSSSPVHVHDFVEVMTKEATCTECPKWIMKCKTCGQTTGYEYQKGSPLGHLLEDHFHSSDDNYHVKKCQRKGCNYVQKEKHIFVNDPTYSHIKSKGTCRRRSVYYKVCRDCGHASKTETFTGDYGDHVFTNKVVGPEFLKQKGGSLFKNASTYYKSCRYCRASSKGMKGESTFNAEDIQQVSFGYYPQHVASRSEESILATVTPYFDVYYLSQEERFIKSTKDNKFYKLEPIIWNLNKVVTEKGEDVYELITNEVIMQSAFIGSPDQIDNYTYINSKLDNYLNFDFTTYAFNVWNYSIDVRSELVAKNLTTVYGGDRKAYILASGEVMDSSVAGEFAKSAPIKNLKLTDYAKSFTKDFLYPAVWTRSHVLGQERDGACAFVVKNGVVSIERRCHTMSSVMPVIRLNKANFEKHLVKK